MDHFTLQVHFPMLLLEVLNLASQLRFEAMYKIIQLSAKYHIKILKNSVNIRREVHF